MNARTLHRVDWSLIIGLGRVGKPWFQTNDRRRTKHARSLLSSCAMLTMAHDLYSDLCNICLHMYRFLSSLSQPNCCCVVSFGRPLKHMDCLVQTNAWSKSRRALEHYWQSSMQRCHLWPIPMWSMRVHYWLEEGEHRLAYRRFLSRDV